jgi:hypothetical protein
VFERQADGSWIEQAKLLPDPSPTLYPIFGNSVAISGDTILVGAPFASDVVLQGGAVYVFERQGDGSWLRTAKLHPTDTSEGDTFGFSVALDGDTAASGAYLDSDVATSGGAAYIFERQANGSWTQQAKLVASAAAAGDRFGFSLALATNLAVVGAAGDDDQGTDSGSAYAFQRAANGSWTQVAKFTASDAAPGDGNGLHLAVSGTAAIISARGDDDNGTSAGAAYVFRLANDSDGDGIPDDAVLFWSPTNNENVGGLTVNDEDVVRFEEATGTYSLFFDGGTSGSAGRTSMHCTFAATAAC